MQFKAFTRKIKVFYFLIQIKESADKAVIHVKVSAPRKVASERPNTAPAKVESAPKSTDNSKSKRPASAVTKKSNAKKSSSVNIGNKQ